MVVSRSQNKITDFFMILAWASPLSAHIDSNGQSYFVRYFVRFPECILPTVYNNIIIYVVFYLWFWRGQHCYIMCFNFDTFLSVLYISSVLYII